MHLLRCLTALFSVPSCESERASESAVCDTDTQMAVGAVLP